jgi:hypothetical protein
MVRLISMAMTGYYRTMQRPRAHQPLSMLKYDPIGTPVPKTPPRQTRYIMRTHLDRLKLREQLEREEKEQ